MKLYYTKSACSLAVRIVLNELGRTFQEEEVDLKAKRTKTEENYLEINPKGAVPALRLDNGDVLTENQIILQYLADTTPGQKLLAPVGDLMRYHTLEWVNYIATELHKTVGMFFHPNLQEETKSLFMSLVMARLNFINEHLAKGPYLMGEHFTLPDAYLYVVLRWAHYFKMDLSAYKYLERFMNVVGDRPAVVTSLQQEKL
ncbi:glutathione transferase GstA [Legionella longbeachae]|uniref:Glutathione S-transferase n=1 Tax=Legionella longbeachae serogroup 1 (strain NSW150) TaxID=661367 RepID=D3HRR9_LEGLN|nr:glutathione transferase GstA [Legionella longbeachae]VEE02102.1 glutathione S-transferase [Legionella oakridgensis]HBD7396652.1 glutathione transferase GstA [Legionella pneumophila]ARB91596.1 glutathione transferase GstA [Legionella longbeachae]ARM35259.1 glutathione transferase GstA [Legionella longbeachae]EEZ95282.1 glutathione S-transferase [Legionella longbeachae D-4968]